MNVYRFNENDFNLDYTLSCGQVFRWEKNGWWTGVVNGAIIRAKQDGNEILIDSIHDKNFILDYLDEYLFHYLLVEAGITSILILEAHCALI